MIEYIHLRSETPKRRACLCREFHTQVYRAAFPKPDQSETPEVWLPLMSDDVPDGQPILDIIIARDPTSRIMGGVVFEFHRNSQCWIATYLAVRPEVRRCGVAHGLIREMIAYIGEASGSDWLLFAESENPAFIRDVTERSVAEQRLATMDCLGFRGLPLAYVQPALAPDKHILDDLMLLCYAPDEKPPYAQISANLVAAFLTDFYGALHQANSIHLRRMCAALTTQGVLLVQRLRHVPS